MPPDTLVIAALLGAWALLLLLPFAVAPARMRRRSWQPAEPRYFADDGSTFPDEAWRLIDDLVELGYAERGRWRHEGAALATGRVALLEHPRTLDVARVMVVTVGARVSVTLALQTRFADETEVVTANNRVLAGFPPRPGLTTAWLPEVRDAAALVRVHDQLRDAVGGAGRRVGVGPDPVAFLRTESARVLANWAAARYYRLDEFAQVYRPTWKGALLVTWRLMWPIKPLFRARRRRATRALLAAHGIEVEGAA